MKSRGTILWVDDEVELLQPHILLLCQHGYEVATATSGEDAIELVRQNAYDLIFLDEMMMGMTGLETLEVLKELAPHVPVVMVTKNEAETLMEEAIGRKIDDYLTKPVNPTQILAACKKLLEARRITGERLTQDYLRGFYMIGRRLNEPLTWYDWLEIYLKLVTWSMELEEHPELGLHETLAAQWRECNAAFGTFVEQAYESWLRNPKGEDVPTLSPFLLERFVVPRISAERPVVFIVIDCLRLDQWLVLEDVLHRLYSIERNYACSILPTTTAYARNAIFSGLFPLQIQQYYPQWWHESGDEQSQNAYERQLLESYFQRRRMEVPGGIAYFKIIDPAFGRKVEQEIGRYLQHGLIAIVVNAVDMLVHSRSESPILREIVPDEAAYRTLTRSWFLHSSLFGILRTLATAEPRPTVIITTDHGSIRCLRPLKVYGDRETTTNLRYKLGRNLRVEYERGVVYLRDPQQWLLPRSSAASTMVIAKENYYFVYPTDYHYYAQHYRDSFQHGGISLEEMVLPVAILEPRA
ncbi:MAG: response regulator [Candidatus Kapabacteria bacterium]|nr:response regulator [Candidatus Kapabacteria bacterium]MDW8011651.1 bifunctional response regulator/alkaline phosphatase family protein [Bacteroidota bacterium]